METPISRARSGVLRLALGSLNKATPKATKLTRRPQFRMPSEHSSIATLVITAASVRVVIGNTWAVVNE